MTLEQLWQAALGEIELTLSKAHFHTWLKNTAVVAQENGVVLVSCPNGFTKEWLENKYNKLILHALRNVSEEIREVRYILGKEILLAPSPAARRRRELLAPPPPEEQLDFKELAVDPNTNLNPKYTLESFVVGSFNELAHAAAQAVLKAPGVTYNPLFVYGGVGLGKTHLLQATGNAIVLQHKDLVVKYVTADRLANEIVSSILTGSIDQLKNDYRRVDFLIVDDAQFLSGKDKVQEEIFHTFNVLYQKNKQIIFSSDRPPKAIPTLTERLRSRFEGGMVADIGYPDFETRLAIVKTKAREKELSLDDDAAAYIATHFQKNIRELEGALNRVASHARVSGQSPTIASVQKYLASLINEPRKNTSPKQVIKAVAEFYDLSERDLIERGRKKEIVHPRQIAMFLLREELKNSYPFIGMKLGGRDHTTVMHAYDKISKEFEENENLRREIHLIKERIYNV
ncbi:chromosomal replication initiator protein DnaA [Candidatus Parcubacteria bacterium]|nr:chromosomal replication initiator protein DnaA [Candidatus Parcubacteria bacterium]MBI4385474.1 chromosomal replication initiator protein DnaA [Candidatus Parcubacteria bacterium]